jgi:hypothetical protein
MEGTEEGLSDLVALIEADERGLVERRKSFTEADHRTSHDPA